MRLILYTIFVLTSQLVNAQNRITILNSKSYEPIAGATVQMMRDSTHSVLIADHQGVVVIDLSMFDSFVVSATGFITDTLTRNSLRQNVLLQPLHGALEEVVVTGTLRTIQRTASPVPVEVYSPKFFMKNPSPALFDALQMINGVRPQLNCNVCNTGDIHINGLEGPYTMILIDGMPIVSSLASVYGLFGIPNSLVERIEIVKGPASSLYGSEAMGGLINVITKNPAKTPRLFADVSTNTWHEHNIDLGLGYRLLKKSHALLGVNLYHYNDPRDMNGDNFTDVTLQKRVSLFNKISFARKNERPASIALRYIHEDRWGGEMNWSKAFKGSDSIYAETIETRRFELIGNYTLPVSKALNFSYSLNSHQQRSAYGTTIFNADQRIIFGQLTWERSLAKADVLMGIAGRYTYYDDNTPATRNGTGNENQPDKFFVPGLFVQNEWSLRKGHLLLTGARLDYDKRHGAIFTPRLAYKVQLANHDVLRLNAGSGFRVVNVFTEDHAALTGAREVVIVDKLKPEKSYNINLNFIKKVQWKRSWLDLDLSAWYTYFTNRILPDYTTDANKILYRNLSGYSISRGLSLNAEAAFANSLRINAGASLVDVLTVDGQESERVKKRQPLTEPWSTNWTISYTIPKIMLTIDYTGNVYGPMLLPVLSDKDPRPDRSPVWSIQNIQLSKKLSTSFQVYGGVKNILNFTPAKSTPFLIARSNDPFDKRVKYDDRGNVLSTPDNPYALTFDPNYVYAPNQGRKFYIGLRYELANTK